jgi:hypothetical protein
MMFATAVLPSAGHCFFAQGDTLAVQQSGVTDRLCAIAERVRSSSVRPSALAEDGQEAPLAYQPLDLLDSQADEG